MLRENDDNWPEYRRLVLEGLNTLDRNVTKVEGKLETAIGVLSQQTSLSIANITDALHKFQIQTTENIVQLQTKSAIAGAVGGAIMAGIVALIVEVVVKK